MFFIKKKKEIVEKTEQPKVEFKDTLLEARVGLWSEVLFSDKAKELTSINYYHYLDNFTKIPIPASLLKEIEIEFSRMLAIAGVDKSETCILDNYDIDTFTFNCHLKNANRDAKISLRWGDKINEPNHFTFEDQDTTLTYEYLYFRDGRPSMLELKKFTINNGEKAFKRDLWSHSACFTVTNNNYILKIAVNHPDGIGYCPNGYRLTNEEQLQDYLLSVSLPIDISELYKKIRDISLGDTSNYPIIRIQINKKENGNEEDKLTDEVILKYGKMQSFTRTKDGKMVTLDKNGNWVFASPKLSINSAKDGKINYSLKMDSYDELVTNLSNNQFPKANEEVSEVKQLTKTIFN